MSKPSRFGIGQRFVSTFLAGVFGLLPIVITVAIVTWVVGQIDYYLGEESTLGAMLQSLGIQFIGKDNPLGGFVLGWALVLISVWFFGLFMQSEAKYLWHKTVNFIVDRLPFVKGVYGTASKVVGMLNQDDKGELSGMSVVFCCLTENGASGFLALAPSGEIFEFGGREHRVIYIPTSPVPMTGGLLFVPQESVTRVDMTVDQLMQIYLSLGVLTGDVIAKGSAKNGNGENPHQDAGPKDSEPSGDEKKGRPASQDS
ncbi:MAG: DUF502 domain-containing protein [Planctomycetales bacterium]